MSHSGFSFRGLALCLIFLLLLCFGFLALLPSFVSTSLGKRWFCRFVEHKTGTHLEIDSLSLHWFEAQSAEGIRGSNAKHHYSFQCPKALCTAPLWTILTQSNLQTLRLDHVVVEYHSSLSSFIPIKAPVLRAAGLPMPHFGLNSALSGELIIQEGQIILSPPEVTPIYFNEITLCLDTIKRSIATLELSCTTVQANTQGNLQLKGSAEALETAYPHIHLHGHINNLPVQGLDELVSLFYPQKSGLLYSALGNNLNMDCDVSISEGNVDLNLSAKSQTFSLSASAYTSQGKLLLKSPAECQFILNLQENEPCTVTLSDFSSSLPLSKESLIHSVFTVKMSAGTPPLFSLQGKSDGQSLHLSCTSKDFVLPDLHLALQEPFSLLAPAPFTLSLPHIGAIDGTIQQLQIPHEVSVHLQADQVSDVFSAVVGKTGDATLKMQNNRNQYLVDLTWVSPNSRLNASFNIDHEGIRLKNQGEAVWTLTPAGYAALDHWLAASDSAPFALAENSTFSITLNQLFLPKNRSWKEMELNCSANNSLLSFLDQKFQEKIQISRIDCQIDKNSHGMKSSSTAAVTAQNKNGNFSLTTSLPNLPSDLSQFTGTLQLKAQEIPSRALDILARAKGRTDSPFAATFGSTINAAISLNLNQLTGPISAQLLSPLTQLDIDGKCVDGALLLNKDLFAQMKVTPEFSRLIFNEINPLNLSYLYSQDPITLQAAADGFYLPLYPFDPGKIGIKATKLELGKVFCHNEGNINTALNLLKSKQFEKSSELSLWFAPLEMSITQGTATIERTEILLADTFDICIWGRIDLIKMYVNMLLGLTSDTLSKAFGIKGLPETYVLTIPMKGPANNVKINTSKATAKVALLLAWQSKNVEDALGGGATGAIVGGLLGKVATLPDMNAQVPPAKHPFPWEIGQKQKTSDSSHQREKKRQFKITDKPLKQIIKVFK